MKAAVCVFALLLVVTVHAVEVDRVNDALSASENALEATLATTKQLNKADANAAVVAAPDAKKDDKKVQENSDAGTTNFNPGKGKITVISNQNSLDQTQAAPERVDTSKLMEMSNKANDEMDQKKKDEAAQKASHEEGQKKLKSMAMKHEANREEAGKKQMNQQATNRLNEEKGKHDRRKQEAEQGHKQEMKKLEEQAVKKKEEAAALERKAEQAKKADEKAAEATKKDNAKKEQTQKTELKQKQAISVDLRNGWHNYGHSYAPASSSVINGRCYVEGLLRRGGRGNIGVLPVGCRPNGRLIFNLIDGDRSARVDVLTDGRIYFIAGHFSNWLSLSQISFDIKTGSSVSFGSHWRGYGHSYRHPTVRRVGRFCQLGGLARGNRHHGTVLTMTGDRNCYPNQRMIFIANNHQQGTRVDVLSDGRVILVGAQHHGWIALDNILFFTHGGKGLPLYNGFRNYGGSYRGAQYYTGTDGVCVVSGLIRSNRRGRLGGVQITTLPSDCRPMKGRLIFQSVTSNGRSYNNQVRIDVLRSGAVHVITGWANHHWIPLDGIKFRVA